jgi:hypothetical protein
MSHLSNPSDHQFQSHPVINRQLLKRILYASIKEFPAECKEKLMAITKPVNARLRREIEKEISKVLSKEFEEKITPEFTVLHSYQIKSVRESSRNDEASILVHKPGFPGRFEDESVLFASINERFSDEYVEIYAPVSWSDRAERNKRLKKVVPLIKEIIVSRIPTMQLALDI